MRHHAVTALREVRNTAAVPALIDLLHDPDPSVRNIVLFVLTQMTIYATHLLGQTLDDDDPLARAGAATVLGRIGADGALRPIDKEHVLPALFRRLQSDTESAVRWQVVVALGKVGDVAAVPALIGALADPHEPIRARAAFILGRMGDTSAIPALRIATEDISKSVRASAATALQKLESLAAD